MRLQARVFELLERALDLQGHAKRLRPETRGLLAEMLELSELAARPEEDRNAVIARLLGEHGRAEWTAAHLAVLLDHETCPGDDAPLAVRAHGSAPHCVVVEGDAASHAGLAQDAGGRALAAFIDLANAPDATEEERSWARAAQAEWWRGRFWDLSQRDAWPSQVAWKPTSGTYARGQAFIARVWTRALASRRRSRPRREVFEDLLLKMLERDGPATTMSFAQKTAKRHRFVQDLLAGLAEGGYIDRPSSRQPWALTRKGHQRIASLEAHYGGERTSDR